MKEAFQTYQSGRANDSNLTLDANSLHDAGIDPRMILAKSTKENVNHANFKQDQAN